MLIVGGGPGGLACAIRLGQLLEEHPEVRERLGDVPVAVLEKGKQAGSHLFSGAVVAPRALRELFKGRLTLADIPTYGEVPGEAVYVLTRRSAFRIPAPPTMRNHGNVIVSVSELSRFLAEQAEALGVAVLPETAATKLLVHEGRVVGVRTGDRGRGRHGEQLPTFEAGSDVVSSLTVLAEGTQGLLTSAAIERFGLHGENPQIWALGVKEVWRVPKPLERIVHTMALAAADAGRIRRVRRLVHLPDGRGPRVHRLRRRPRGARRRVLGARRAPGAEDAPPRLEDPGWRRARRLGREDDHRGRLLLAAAALQRSRAPARRREPRASSTCPGSRASTTRSSRVGWRPRRRSARCSAERCRADSAPSTRTTRRCARVPAGRSSTRSGTCARRSTGASSSAERSRA